MTAQVISKIGLGTVQFGLDYGVSNRGGKTPRNEVARILERAAALGIDLLDTAPAYGTSEEVIGSCAAGHEFRVVTKTASDIHAVRRTFEASLKKMRIDRAYGLLVHKAEDILGPHADALYRTLIELKDEGLVMKIGVSTYAPDEVIGITERFRIDLLQLPLNVFDQRPLQHDLLRQLRNAGVEIHIRSAFLQGALLMRAEDLPPHFDRARKHIQSYHAAIRDRGLTPLRAALGFVLGVPEVDAVICGVNDAAQLAELAAAATPGDPQWFESFAIADETIINPSMWPPVKTTPPVERTHASS